MSELNNIDNSENERLNPDLYRSGNSNPFRTAADYFDNFQAKINARVEEQTELLSIAPVLSSIPKYNPFEVPKHYFEELPTGIQQQCNGLKPAAGWMEWLKMLMRPNFAVPVLTVIFIAFAGIHYMHKTEPVKIAVAEEMSVEEQLQNIDESTLIDALAASATENESAVENDPIKEYLIDNNIDESNLNTEL